MEKNVVHVTHRKVSIDERIYKIGAVVLIPICYKQKYNTTNISV